MNIEMCCGKGGVGKTLSAVSIALTHAQLGDKTGLIDLDGGHSVAQTLGIEVPFELNTIVRIEPNLSVVVIENTTFVSANSWKADERPFEGYMAQFPADFGILAFADMVNEFFGVPCDVPTLQKFVVLVQTLNTMLEHGYHTVIIDVEPTAGLGRLLQNADAMARSLQNLKQQSRPILLMIKWKWRDIAAYIESAYIQDVEQYCDRLDRAARMVKGATSTLVCTPQRGPVHQTFQVRKLVEGAGGVVRACVVNNVREEHSEVAAIELLAPHRLPIIRVPHYTELDESFGDARRALLLKVGSGLVRGRSQ